MLTGRPSLNSSYRDIAYLLERLAEDLGIQHRVTFVGNQKGEELVRQVKRGWVAVVPSAWAEPMGGVAVELMAAGRPVIVSREGGLAECVGAAGLTFENGSAVHLALTMTQLKLSPYQRLDMAAEGRERAKEFDPDKFIDQYVALLRELTPNLNHQPAASGLFNA